MNSDHCPTFSIVVPTFNRPAALSRFLSSIRELDYPLEEVEVVLVDDSGKNHLGPVVAPFRKELAVVLLCTSRLGPSPARLCGVRAASGKYLAFTDDDCVPARDWLQRMEAGLAQAPRCAVGGKTCNGVRGNPYSSATQLMIDMLMEDSNRPRVSYLTTSNVVFEAEELMAAQGLDENWHNWGGEDRELCRRWLKAGKRMRYDPHLVVHHYHPLTLAEFWKQHYRYGRGSCRYHRQAGYQSPAFYLRLIGAGFQRRESRPWLMGGLLLLAQLATLAGFIRERLPLRWAGEKSKEATSSEQAS